MKDTINIHSILHNLDFKNIKQKIENIIQHKEPEKLIVIAPNAFIAQRISDLLKYNDSKKEKFKFYTWENIDFNTLFDKEIEMSLEAKTQIKKKDFKITIPIQYLKNEAYSNPLVKFYKAVVNDSNTRRMIAYEHSRISEALIKRQDETTKQFTCFPEDNRTVSLACHYVNGESDTLEKMLKQYQHPTFQLCFTLLLKQSNLWGKENISKEEAEKNQAFIYLNKLCDDIKNDLALLSQKNIFAKEDKQKFEKILDDTFDEIKKNLIKVLEDGDKDKTRTLWLIGITIATVIVGIVIGIATLRTGTLAVVATLGAAAFDIGMGINDIIDYEEELEKMEASKFYLPFVVPLMKTLFEDISYISALCSTQLYSCMIFYDNKFLDLSAIDFSCFFKKGKDMLNQNTHIIEGECDQDLKCRILQNFGITTDKPTQTKEKKQDELGNISTLHTFNPNINDFSKNYQCALDLYEEQDKDFKNFVFVEQPQFLSRGLAKLIKNDISKGNASSKQNKNYLLISQAPHNTMVNLSQSITEEIFNTNIVRPEAPKDQTQIDYSKYDLEQDEDSKEFVLQLSPFVKESATEAKALKEWFKKKNNNVKLKEIASHFLSAEYKKNIENIEKKIKENQKNLYKTLLDNLTLKSFNKNHPDGRLKFLPIEQILQIGLIIASAKIQKIPIKITSSHYPNNHNIDLKELSELFYKIATDKAFLEQLNNKLQIGDIEIDLSEDYKSVDDFILKNIIPKEELDSAYDENNFKNLRREILKKAFEDFISSLVPFADGFEKAFAKLALIFALTSIAVIVKNKELIKNLSLLGKNFSSMLSKKELAKGFLQDFLKLSAKDLKTAGKEILDSFHPSLALLLALKEDYKILKNNKEFVKKLSHFRIDENVMKDTVDNLHSDSKKRLNINKKIEGHLFTYVDLKGSEDKIKASAYTRRKGVMQDLGFYHRMRFFKTLASPKELATSVGISAISSIAKYIANDVYKTLTQNLLAEYEDIFFLNLERHHRPYATIRNEFLSYPLALHSNFASYNFSTALFGSRLEALSLEIFPNIMLYSSTYKKVRQEFSTSAVYTIREMVVKKLLSYIVPDELRGGLDDKSFMQKILQRHITKEDIVKQYYLDENFIHENLDIPQKEIKRALIEKFKDNRNGNEYDVLKAYNELIKILSEVISGNLNAKGKQILSSLKIIGKNNIKALYVGINDENSEDDSLLNKNIEISRQDKNKTSEKRPPFLGRLATTIIAERTY